VFHRAAALARRLPGPRALRPAGGGLLVGLLALGIPQTLGTGYGWVQHALDRQSLAHMSLWLVLALPVAKILATALSIGSGGSGGVFGPGMVIGAFVGAAVWRVAEPFAPGVPADPAPLVIVGMMACFGSIARTPLGMILMVAEMTGGPAILAPATLAIGVACLITRRSGAVMYRNQIRVRDARHAPSPAPGDHAHAYGPGPGALLRLPNIYPKENGNVP
jgi:CIC family chloride channel protein